MARLIQQTIKTPLADEVLFGRLKNGGAVKVVVVQSETGIKVLGLEFPDGPAKPKPEPDVAVAVEKRERKPRPRPAAKPKAGPAAGLRRSDKDEPPGDPPKGGRSAVRSVPKVPLSKA
jgi:ATP-dependent Clp protease ATP-binding subunit ClpA